MKESKSQEEKNQKEVKAMNMKQSVKTAAAAAVAE